MKRKYILFTKVVFIILLSFLVTCTRTRMSDNGGKSFKTEEASILEKKPVVMPETEGDPGLFFYRNTSTREKVVAFYTAETGLEEISRAVLEAANENDIPLSLAFSLCWVESRYNPYAINRNEGTLDRGLFQLNSGSFPDLEEADFYSIDLNSRYGMEYLRYCLNAGENEIVALAMYNAGRHRVMSRGAPVSTLEYISQIVSYRDELDHRFLESFMKEPSTGRDTGGERLVKAVQPRVKSLK